MKLVTAQAYFDTLLHQLPKAKKRIVLHAMTILWGPRTEQLLPILTEAARRGVDVRVVGDIYSKFVPRLPRPFRDKLPPWKQVAKLNEQLRVAGVHVAYAGKLGTNPFKHRIHSKCTIIDDLVYSFGGINITDDSLDNHDYMIEASSPRLADYLYDLVRAIEADGSAPLQNRKERITEDTTLLFDGGSAGMSVIYDTACELVADAKKAYFVSQMCPSGRLAPLLKATDNECYFVRFSQADFPASLVLARDKARYRIKSRYHGETYIHAKLILTIGKDGRRHVLTGSNNFSWRGVAYGTKEIALHSTNPGLWQELYDFMQQEIINEPRGRAPIG
jgi:cardiolipin synthase